VAQSGAKVIAFDMLFPGPRDGDEEFAAALEKYGDRVIIGCNIQESQSEQDERNPTAAPSQSLIPGDGGLFDPRVGFVNFRPDLDGKVRAARYRTTLLEGGSQAPREGDPEIFSLAARMAQKFGKGDLIPKDSVGHLFRYSDQVHPVSLAPIFVPELWKAPPYRGGELFKDKIVLVGPFGNWAKDELDTPLGLRPGPQIHLSALNALLRNDYLRESSASESLALILTGGLVAWLLGQLVAGAVLRLVLLLVGVAGYVGLAFLLYNLRGFYPILLSPVLALSLSGAAWAGLERLLEVFERMRLRSTLEKYVSRDVVKEVLDNPASFLNTLGGSRKKIAVLFSDVRSFTSLTENAVPEVLVGQLREYFTAMVHIVFTELGTLDKFIGDAVMAHWGSATTRGEAQDARSAVSAGLEMLRQIPKLNETWKARGLPAFNVGIGINHGEAICGNLGSDEKQEFTAIGDAVNVASRMESATKTYHVRLLIGEGTAALVRDHFTLRTVDQVIVSGKTQPVEIFTVIDTQGGAPVPAWLAPYEAGIQLYRRKQFAEAERSFAQAAALDSEDWLIQEYLRRTRELQAEPPPPDWDGVFTMKSK
jgi:adenylate cyclase